MMNFEVRKTHPLPRNRSGSRQKYRKIYIEGKHVFEHRFVAENEIIHRSLKPGETVHHRNEDINDNRPENLVVMTRKEHSRLHRLGHKASPERLQKQSLSNTLYQFDDFDAYIVHFFHDVLKTSYKVIALMYNCSERTIQRVRKRPQTEFRW